MVIVILVIKPVAAKRVAATFVAVHTLPENSRFPTSSDQSKKWAYAQLTKSAETLAYVSTFRRQLSKLDSADREQMLAPWSLQSFPDLALTLRAFQSTVIDNRLRMASDDGDEISQPGYSARVQLCEQCQNIDLGLQASDYKCWLETKQERSWTLGTYAQVKSRNCPFCQLAGSVCLIRNNGDSFQREDPDDSSIVSVSWSTHLLRYHVQPASLETYLGFTSSQDTSVCDLAGCFKEYINSSLPQQWLSHCDSKHGRRCSPIVFNKKVLRMDGGSPFILRVIDVTLMCIVDAPDACRYIALSYVWGNPSDGRLVLNAKNKEILTMPNALGLVRSQIPKTIFGAITFTRDIGERYLWVDSLCLVQDDEDEILQCTLIMDAYFSMATLTIVAASGKDAHTGIPGIAQIPRQDTRVIKNVAPGVFMTAQNELDMYLRNSIYATRGWT